MFTSYLDRWGLTPDGEPIFTHSSSLLPVRQGSIPAMLKIAQSEEELAGGILMSWWNGEGAARVFARDGTAILLERAEGCRSLAQLAQQGRDDEASRIICDVVAKLHLSRAEPPEKLVPLHLWFRELEPVAVRHGGIFAKAAAVARDLLAAPQGVVVLHGDIHHGNILDFGARGWLAIDPKGLIGERGFDFANIFCNPDHEVATATGRLARQAKIIADASGQQHARLLQWVLAYAGLSAAWSINEGGSPELALDIAAEAAAELRIAES
jgi:streptomycin 6-kinase